MAAEGMQWLERGRTHQREARPVDAMLCFRRAMRLDPQSAAGFHLGEVLWQMGRVPDALAAWERASAVDVTATAARFALAESRLATRELAQALAESERLLAIQPDDSRAHLIRAIARHGLTTDDDSIPAEALAEAIGREPGLLAVPSLGGPLAATIDRRDRDASRSVLADALGQAMEREGAAERAPALLLAWLAESDTDAGRAVPWSTIAARAYGASELDALRRLALTAHRHGVPEATLLARRYAELCLAAFEPSAPLLWPRRTAGAVARIGLLEAARPVSTLAGELARLVPSAQITRLVLDAPHDGNAAAAPEAAGQGAPPSIADATAGVPSDAARDAPGHVEQLALGASPGADDAKRVAALDLDLLIDARGLEASSGPLLAQRPARRLVSIATHPHAVPLADAASTQLREVLHGEAPADAAGSVAAPEHASASTMPSPAAMMGLFTEAIEAHRRGAPEEAAAAYDRVLALQPGHAVTHYLRGMLRRDGGNAAQAGEDFAAALAVAPRYLEARIAAAQLALDAGRFDAVERLVQPALVMAPGYVALWRALGLARLGEHRPAAALELFDKALQLDVTDGQTHYNAGVALQMQRRWQDAARAYQRALALAPGLTSAEYNLGVLFQEQGAFDAAVAAYRQVLAAEPAHVAAHASLGEVLFAAGQYDAWREHFDAFERACPDALPLAVQALEVCQWHGDWARLDRYLEGLGQQRFVARTAQEVVDSLEQLLYLLLFFDVDPEVHATFARTYDAAAQAIYGVPRPRAASRRPGRVRIGYLSADLRDHVMGKMMWQALERHDRGRFELFFYALSDREDAWTERYRSLGSGYRVLAGLPLEEAVERVAADDLDLLVDLSTHTRGAQPGIVAHKPARVTLTHVASAGTLGLSAVDFKLTDRYADVVPATPGASGGETLLAMDGCVYPYRHVAPPQAHPFTRERLGIDADAVLIGAFVTAMKLSRRCLSLWREVLERLPQARIVCSPVNAALAKLYVRVFAAGGIPVSRLLFLPQGRDDAENQARYALIDLVLDPMPFGGVNGTLEALDMGVPVVTLAGRTHGERTSFSILANLGVTDTVASTGPEYVDLAVRLATDRTFMQDVRTRIRAGIAHSPLTDMEAHTRHLEAAYREALAARAPEALAGEAGASGGRCQ